MAPADSRSARVWSGRGWPEPAMPASSPANSPTCHWRARNHRGSRTCACSDRSSVASRGCGSRRVHEVTEGCRICSDSRATEASTNAPEAMTSAELPDGADDAVIDHKLLRERGRGRGRLQVEREVQRRADLSDLGDAGQVDAADPGQVVGLVDDRRDELAVPGGSAVRAAGEQPGLRRAGVRLVVVERDAGVVLAAGDPFDPFVDEQPGVRRTRSSGRRRSRPRWPPGPNSAGWARPAADRASGVHRGGQLGHLDGRAASPGRRVVATATSSRCGAVPDMAQLEQPAPHRLRVHRLHRGRLGERRLHVGRVRWGDARQQVPGRRAPPTRRR